MFKLFKKQKEFKKRTQQLIYVEEEIDIGVTFVYITTSRGDVFTLKQYGEVHSKAECGYDETVYGGMIEPKLCYHFKYTSQQVAERLLSEYLIRDVLIDDAKNPSIAYKGPFVKAVIKSTESYIETVKVPKIVLI